MNILGVIPARYASTRFPGKPLIDIGGKSMIRRVYEQVMKATCIRKVVVATDHDEIFQHVQSFGGNVCMTRQDHVSGTDRCYEALLRQEGSHDYVINVQGDEPFILPSQIDLLGDQLDGKTEIGTLVKGITEHEMLFNPNVVKAVLNKSKKALYFSRAAIPHLRNVPETEWLNYQTFYKHIGMYGYRSDVLRQITKLPVGKLEKAESLEQLRWLENGFTIAVAVTEEETMGIDTPDDLAKALRYLKGSDDIL